MAKDTLTVTDNRTGKTYEIPIANGTIRAMDLRQIKVDANDFGMMSYDPAFTNTASTTSKITFIDGDAGILRYRGYPIEELAEEASFLEVAYLLMNGELPKQKELDSFSHEIVMHTMVHENIRELMDGFRYDAHPMGILISTVSALSTFYPEAKNIADADNRRLQMIRMVAKIPSLAAYAYRHRRGLPVVYPDNELSYAGNFLNMMFKMTEAKYKPNPAVERALDVLFTLHADHEQNCSTNAMRGVGSSKVDPYSALAAACAALYGPLHGGANEEVIHMLQRIGSKSKVPEFIESVKKGEGRLMGFGHRVYKNFDPRAKIIREMTHKVLGELGVNDPLLEVAMKLEEAALKDEYFIQRRLYPNVDFYSGIIYKALKIPTEMFTVMFAIGRTAGWVAHWLEQQVDPEAKIGRPRQIYTGYDVRDYKGIDQR